MKKLFKLNFLFFKNKISSKWGQAVISEKSIVQIKFSIFLFIWTIDFSEITACPHLELILLTTNWDVYS